MIQVKPYNLNPNAVRLADRSKPKITVGQGRDPNILSPEDSDRVFFGIIESEHMPDGFKPPEVSGKPVNAGIGLIGFFDKTSKNFRFGYTFVITFDQIVTIICGLHKTAGLNYVNPMIIYRLIRIRTTITPDEINEVTFNPYNNKPPRYTVDEIIDCIYNTRNDPDNLLYTESGHEQRIECLKKWAEDKNGNFGHVVIWDKPKSNKNHRYHDLITSEGLKITIHPSKLKVIDLCITGVQAFVIAWVYGVRIPKDNNINVEILKTIADLSPYDV